MFCYTQLWLLHAQMQQNCSQRELFMRHNLDNSYTCWKERNPINCTHSPEVSKGQWSFFLFSVYTDKGPLVSVMVFLYLLQRPPQEWLPLTYNSISAFKSFFVRCIYLLVFVSQRDHLTTFPARKPFNQRQKTNLHPLKGISVIHLAELVQRFGKWHHQKAIWDTAFSFELTLHIVGLSLSKWQPEALLCYSIYILCMLKHHY